VTTIPKARKALNDAVQNAPEGPWIADQVHHEFDDWCIANDAFLNPTDENEHEPILDIQGISGGTARLIVLAVGLLQSGVIDGILADGIEESGVCHCGTELENHGNEEHSFVDMGYPPNPYAERIAAEVGKLTE
jgi:hypothetical protein